MVTAKAVARAAVAEDCLKYSSFRINRRRACDENIVESPNLFSSNSAGVVKVRSAVGNGLWRKDVKLDEREESAQNI